jgi:hypothetical protein
MPEGIEMDDAMRDSFSVLAKSHHLDQAGAQAFVDLHAQQLLAARAADTAMLNEQVVEWQKQIKSTPEGLENIKRANRVIQSHMTAEQKEFFVGGDSWLASHPAVISLLASFDRKLSEDAPPTGNPSSEPTNLRPCDAMFPHLARKK